MLLYHFLIPCIVIHIGKLPIEWAIVFQFDDLSTDINLVCGCALMVVWSATFPKLSLVHIVSTVVMSLSWNFPSWAEPSYKVAKPSRAGHFNFRAETELSIFFYSRASNIAFLLDWAQMSDLDFGLIQQNISIKKASFQY